MSEFKLFCNSVFFYLQFMRKSWALPFLHPYYNCQRLDNFSKKVTWLIFIKYILFPRQSLERFTSRVKSSDSIFFLLGLSPIVNYFEIESKSLSIFRGRYCFIHLEILQRPKKGNYYVKILFKTRSYCPHRHSPHLNNFILFE